MELLRELKFLDPTLHTILISAGMSVPMSVEALRAEIDDCVVKPIAPRQLLHRREHGVSPTEDELLSLVDVEWEHIASALRTHDGNISRSKCASDASPESSAQGSLAQGSLARRSQLINQAAGVSRSRLTARTRAHAKIKPMTQSAMVIGRTYQ